MQKTLDQRATLLRQWLELELKTSDFDFNPLPADASFRRYFRIGLPAKSLIAMDAPPSQEDCHPFVTLARLFGSYGLCVPKIIATNYEAGFLLLSDLGDDLFFRILNPNNADLLYRSAISALLKIQTCQSQIDWQFKPYTDLLAQELLNFRKWFLLRHLQLDLSAQEESLLQTTFTHLLNQASLQSQACVHRDYHSRNLLLLPNNDTGILDFQDAMWGPISYDLVSLLRDCYITWPPAEVVRWARIYQQQAYSQNILSHDNFDEFMRWFDWMGLQRHLKAIFIFARKYRRDDNTNYLNDIPRTLNYVLEVVKKYPEFHRFHEFLENRVLTASNKILIRG